MLKKTIVALAGWLVLGMGLPAAAATLLETSEVLAANPEAAAQLPPSREFTLSEAGDYVVTLTDLGVPVALREAGDLSVAPMQSLQALITRGLETVAQVEIESPTDPNVQQPPAKLSFAGTPGTYQVHVVGTIASGEGAGFFSINVAAAGGGDAVFDAADSIASASGPAPGQAVLRATFTTTAAGTYRVRALDRKFPSALDRRDVLVLRTAPTTTPVLASSGQPFSTADVGSFNASAGDTYELIVIATAGTDMAGLYGVVVQGGPSDAVIYSNENPVGQLPPASTLTIPSAGTRALTIADLEFPEPLQAFSAAILQNGTFAGSVTGASSANLTLNAGPAQLFLFARPATVGALSATLSQGTQIDYAEVHIADASPDPTTPAIYSFTPSQAVSAGDYTLTVADLRFPASLPNVRAAVVQGATVVHETDAAGSEPVTLEAGPVRVLVAATPPALSGTTPGNGVFSLSLTSKGSNVSVLESTQGVGGLFIAQPLNVPKSGRYDVSLKDFEFPARLRTSWLAITRGTNMVGQVIGTASIQNLQLEAGTHVLSFLGQTAENASYGTFGMKVADATTPPVVTLTATPASVTNGQSTSLQWSATDATACTASGGWSGTKSVSGTQQTMALVANTTFDIECVGPGGRDVASVTVTVNASSRGGGGGGHMDPVFLLSLGALLTVAGIRGRRRTRV